MSCEAVGAFSNLSGLTDPLGESWNGSGWHTQRTATVAGAESTSLYSVSCSSATSCMAVGSALVGADHEALSESWSDGHWSDVRTPAEPESVLLSVSCPSARLCVAVGSKAGGQAGAPLVESWSGSRWSTQHVPLPKGAINVGLYGVACPTTADCVAVGMYQNSTDTTLSLAEEWTGRSWTIIGTPNVRSQGDVLDSVACSSSSYCVSVGSATTSVSGMYAAVAELWNGTSWRMSPHQPTDVQGASTGAIAVSCSASTSCTLVGDAVTSVGQEPVAESFNGSAWTSESTAAPAASDGVLAAVSCGSTRICSAVGSADGLTLAEAN